MTNLFAPRNVPRESRWAMSQNGWAVTLDPRPNERHVPRVGSPRPDRDASTFLPDTGSGPTQPQSLLLSVGVVGAEVGATDVGMGSRLQPTRVQSDRPMLRSMITLYGFRIASSIPNFQHLLSASLAESRRHNSDTRNGYPPGRTNCRNRGTGSVWVWAARRGLERLHA